MTNILCNNNYYNKIGGDKMKIAVICANGKAGKMIVNEAIGRGLDVTSIARGDNKTVSKKYLNKDIFDLTKDDLAQYDVIVDAFGVFTEDLLPMHSTSLMHLCDLISGTNKRILVVGGAGSLYTNKEHTSFVLDSPDFPDIFLPVAKAQSEALKKLRDRDDVNWTFISPACDFQVDGERTGEYILAGEELTLNDKGESIISYADYAIAMVDEILNAKHIKKRISVLRK